MTDNPYFFRRNRDLGTISSQHSSPDSPGVASPDLKRVDSHLRAAAAARGGAEVIARAPGPAVDVS
eukprot:scaffold48704_cov41-Phaeocystis_antarctica.AAC.2